MHSSNEIIANFSVYLKRQGKSESTRIAYKKDLEQIASTNVKKSLLEFTQEDIKSGLNLLKQQKNLSAKTLSRKLNSIRTFYNYLVSTKKIVYNPSLEVSHPKYLSKKKRILKTTEYLALREACRDNKRLYAIVETLLQSGIRISELSRLKLRDVDLSKIPYLYISPYESNEERKVPINQRLFFLLKSYIETEHKAPKANAPLFYTRSGKHIEIRNIRSTIDRAILKAKLKEVCVNDLRNTFIVHQLENGMSTQLLSVLVGHKNEVTTQKYLRLLNKKYKPTGTQTPAEL